MAISSYIDLQELSVRARKGDLDAVVELAEVYRNNYARISLAEAVRQCHIVMFKAIALQISNDYKGLLSLSPSLADVVNAYKDHPSLQHLHSILETLFMIGERSRSDWSMKINVLISRAFKTLSSEYKTIMSKIMATHESITLSSTEAIAFLSNPTFRTFVECVKMLNSEFKCSRDHRKSLALLMYALNHGNKKALSDLIEHHNQSCIQLCTRDFKADSLLGKRYIITTIWDDARRYSEYPL